MKLKDFDKHANDVKFLFVSHRAVSSQMLFQTNLKMCLVILFMNADQTEILKLSTTPFHTLRII